MNLSILLLFPLLALAGDPKPNWVDGNAENYPDAKYMIAVGNGNTRAAATENAKQSLASSFRLKVKSSSSTEAKSSLHEDTAANTSGDANSSSQSSVEISTEIELRGVEIKEYWQDSETKEHFALAVLDKLKLRNSYLLELTKTKEALLSLRDRFQAKPEQKTGREILSTAEKYASLAKEAAVVGTPLPGTEPLSGKELESVKAKLEELKGAKPIALSIVAETKAAEEEAGDLEQAIADCLTDKGYSVGEGKNTAAQFTGNYRVKTKHLKVEGFVSYEFSVKAFLLKGTHSDRKLFTKTANAHVQDQAFDAAKEELSSSICTMIVQSL